MVTCGRSNASARPLDPVSGSSGILKGGGAKKVAGITGRAFVSRSRPQTSPPEGNVPLILGVESARESRTGSLSAVHFRKTAAGSSSAELCNYCPTALLKTEKQRLNYIMLEPGKTI